MKRFVLALTLACALSSTVLAGNVPTSDVAGPQPTETPGNVPTSDVTGSIPTSDALTMLLSIISAVV